MAGEYYLKYIRIMKTNMKWIRKYNKNHKRRVNVNSEEQTFLFSCKAAYRRKMVQEGP